MEFAIPITRFDPQNVKWGIPRPSASKQTVGFLYEDMAIRTSSLILVLEPLEVVFIDWEKKQIANQPNHECANAINGCYSGETVVFGEIYCNACNSHYEEMEEYQLNALKNQSNEG